jgi:pilus assembly protein CpaC
MHHTTSLSRVTFGILLVFMLTSEAPAQAPVPPPPPQPGGTGAAAAGAQLILPIGGSRPVRMSTRRNIVTVNNLKPSVARVQAVPDDPTSILVTGLEAGVTDVVLVDVNGTRETIVVTVQFDVEYLRHMLAQIVPTATIEVVPGTNSTVILRGHVARAEDVNTIIRAAQSVVGAPERVINALEVGGVQQVQLDVCVAQVNRSALRRFGFNLLASGPSALAGSLIGAPGLVPTVGTTPPSTFNSGGNGGGGQQTSGILTGGAISAPQGASSFIFGFTAGNTSYLGFLQALRQEGILKLLAKPTLIALSGQQARFLSGGEQAVPESAGLGSVGVQFQPFGTGLAFVPVVLADGRIHLDIHEEVSNLDAALGTSIQGTSVSGRDVQRVDTSVELGDGETFVIGGLIQRQVNATTNKVPVLGDLPYVGAAFSTKEFTETENELIVLVTAHLVAGISCDQLPKLLPGQETRSPDDFELFLEGILEAPHGSREVWPNHRYVPAYKHDPTAGQYPCAADRCNSNGHWGGDGHCATGACVGQPIVGQPVAGPTTGMPLGSPAVQPSAGADLGPAPVNGIRPLAGSMEAPIPPAGDLPPVTTPEASGPPATSDQQPPAVLPPSVPSSDGSRDQ